MKKPKFSVNKIIKKFLIIWDIKLDKRTPVYYAWDMKRQPRWFKDERGMHPEKPFLSVDYDPKKREWYIGYIVSANNRRFCTINDLTGSFSTSAG